MTEVRINLQRFRRFGLVSLFNGISTLFRLFNAKAILLKGTTLLRLGGPECNVNKEVLHTPMISRRRTLTSDSVLNHTQGISLVEGSYPTASVVLHIKLTVVPLHSMNRSFQ